MAADNVKSVCVRFYLDKPLHRKAFNFLQSQTEFSNSQAAVIAIADYFENRNIADRIVVAVEKSLTGITPKSQPTVSENAKIEMQHSDEIAIDEIDFDFLGG